MLITRRSLLASGAFALTGSRISPAQAQFPTRPISLICPAAPGSQTDVFSRILADALGNRLGQPVIVENRPGAGGVVGTVAAIRAAADGYTLLYSANSGTIIAPQVRRPNPYNTPRDLAPVALTLRGPSVIVVNQKVTAQTIEGLVNELRDKPNQLNLGSHGVGSFSHVTMEMFMASTATKMTHLPYNGGGPLGNAFLTGDVHVALLDVVTARPLLDGGKGRALAQVGEKRSPLFENVPLVSETVAPSVSADYWLGVFCPVATPDPIVERLHSEINHVINSEFHRVRASQASMLTEPMSLSEVRSKVARDWDIWGNGIRERELFIQ